MMRLMALVTCVVLAGCTWMGISTTGEEPWGATVEWREKPCGVDVHAPRFAWKLGRVGEENVQQQAYRILVSTSEEKLANDQGDLWDSGKVASRETSSIVYAGRTLPSSTKIYWKVRTWFASEYVSPWCAPQTFVTGLMEGTPWRAKWIGAAPCTRPDEDFATAQWLSAPTNAKGVITLTYEFDFAGVAPGEYVEMVHAGVSQHEIDINGMRFNKFSGSLHDWRYLRFRDMTAWLKRGRNKIVVRVFTDDVPKAEPIDHIRSRAPKGTQAFIAKITFPDGRTLFTDPKTWRSPTGTVTGLGTMRTPVWGREMICRTETTSPAFEKRFNVTKRVKAAILHVTGVGFYEASLNGTKIGDRVLDPSPTAFDKHVLYATYDLSDSLKLGENALRVLVGHGWYDMRTVATWNFETSPWRDFPRAIGQLEITYADGTHETIVTDKTWRQVESPLGYDDIFEGEVTGVKDPRAFDFSKGTLMVQEVSAPAGALVSERQEPAKVMRTFKPKAIHAVHANCCTIDAGENMAGWVRLVLRNQKKGTVVSVRYDERVNDDFSPAAISMDDGVHNTEIAAVWVPKKGVKDVRKIDIHCRSMASHRVCTKDAAFQTDRFVCSGVAQEIYEPRFTYNGFRYVVVQGLNGTLKPEDVTLCVVHTAFPTIGSFACSDKTLNQLISAGMRSYRSNFADGVPTDCPHREKNGWTGDASVASEFAQFVFENTAGYEKWLQDIRDAQLIDGNLPGIVPSSGWGYHWGNGPGWDSALSVIAWNLWIYRGDKRVLAQTYPALVKYLQYTATRADADGLVQHGLGDWIPVNQKHMPARLLTSSCFYYQALSIAARMAGVLGYAQESQAWHVRAQQVKASIHRRCYHGKGVYDNGLQTAQAMALNYGIVPVCEKEQVESRLVKAVAMANGHVDFGLFGAKHVFRALSRMGRTDLAFHMLVNPTKPSYVEFLQKGGEGTTLWEDWGDGISRNHVMFADFIGWAYQYLAGIRLAEMPDSCSAIIVPVTPGFREIVIAPQVIKGLDWVRATVNAPTGEIVSAWHREGDVCKIEVVVPPNVLARVLLPDGASRTVGSGHYTWTVKQ